MVLFFSRNKPKIKVETVKKDNFSGWFQCVKCFETIHLKETGENLNCCPKCNHHYRLDPEKRIDLLADINTFEEKFTNIKPVDCLKFQDSVSYEERLSKAREKTKRDDAVLLGTCKIEKQSVALAVLDFNFMGGSMGSVVGEKIVSLIEYAIFHNLPLVIVSASGGARMQESIFSLMQMAKTSAALTKLSEKGLPYISILTNPTTGGVTASFASLGDIIIAEPDALIAFAGPRVVEQTIKEKLPPGAQRSEFLLDRGMVDCICKRSELKKKVSFFIDFLTNPQDNQKEKISAKLKEFLTIAQLNEKSTQN